MLVSVNYILGSESRGCDVSVWRFPPPPFSDVCLYELNSSSVGFLVLLFVYRFTMEFLPV